MIQTNYNNQDPKNQPEPVYAPNWDDIVERAELLAAYWQSIAEFAKLKSALESLGLEGGFDGR